MNRYKSHFPEYRGATNYRVHQTAKKDGKLRFWIWIVVSTALVILVGSATKFVRRCEESKVFASMPFKLSVLLFMTSLFLGGAILYLSRSFAHRRAKNMWNHHRVLFIAGIVACFLSVALFTISLIPAYKQAATAFGCLGVLFIANLGCLLLY